MKFDIQSLLKDKNVLYVTLFIAISNMFAYLMFRQFDAIIFFIVIAIITSNFSKNMIIIMLVALISTNLAISVKMIGKVKEGFEKMKDTDKKKKQTKEGLEGVAGPNAMKLSSGTKPKATIKPKPIVAPLKGKKGTGKELFTQQLNPARLNSNDDDDDYESHPTVDYASTLETAYDNLDKLLSSDAISSMSEDTHRLAEKQQMLMGNINKLQPMMEKAGSLLEGLKMGDMSNMLEGLQSKLSNLGGK
uniref:Uncharacterized protein n=1 Tax=viral metagenome TaxID=1070528 RepID=A0A6C0IJV3_9ZZZZ